MTDDPRVEQLLDALLDSGETPESVCSSCPELLPQVRERWRQICRARAELDAIFPPVGESGPGLPAAPAGDPPLPEVPGYEVEGVLGVGGMGVVFRARHLRLNRVVALKMTLAGAYAGRHERDRFQREAEAVARLQHPNVVQIHDVGEADGRPYFTMEFVGGGSLAQRLAGHPQPAREAADLVATLAGAVQVAHAAGIVHRDLKPANVLLTADGTPKVSDFGLARRLDGDTGPAHLTWSGTAVGTPSYMAPEQAKGKSDDMGPAADTYALGAILYEVLTGRPPFRAETASETLRQVVAQDPVPPSRLNAAVPRDAETICLKCLQKDPRHRYASAAALADDLRCFLRGESIAARPDGPLARMGRKVRRRPALSAAVAASAALTLAVIGGGVWLLSDRAATARAAEDDLRDTARHLRNSAWPEAGTARDRAKVRLGDGGPAGLRRRLDRYTRDLELADRLDVIRLQASGSGEGDAGLAATDESYAEAFRAAGLGPDDDAAVVAGRIKDSDIRKALVAAFDHWSVCARDPQRRDWILKATREADPDPDTDPTHWRTRARKPEARTDQAELKELIRNAPIEDAPVALLLALEIYYHGDEHRVEFLKRIHHEHPDDFWTNHRLGYVMFHLAKPGEAVGFYQAALAVRPGSALVHNNLGFALTAVGRDLEALAHYQRAVELDATSVSFRMNLARAFTKRGRHDDAVREFEAAVRTDPGSALLNAALGQCLENAGRPAEAFARYTRAVEMEPTHTGSQKALRDFLIRRGQTNDARVAWRAALAANPPKHDAWYGYAELCLYLGDEPEYLLARRELLARFGATTDTAVAERTSRASLLLPATEEELRAAVALADRALAAGRSKNDGLYPYFLFVRGLAEFRQGQFDRAISTLRGDAARVLGPAPRLVLAMALHRKGQEADARRTLAGAVVAHDWRANQVRDQDGWIFHVLRREAERLILPKLIDFLAGNHQPRDNDERLALLGACQAADRSAALARLFADVFASAPQLADSTPPVLLRWQAARAAALAGSGRGADTKVLDTAERRRWRDQARRWLRADLAKWGKPQAEAATRAAVRQWLTSWLVETDLAGLREPAELAKLSADERTECVALWEEVAAAIKHNTDAR